MRLNPSLKRAFFLGEGGRRLEDEEEGKLSDAAGEAHEAGGARLAAGGAGAKRDWKGVKRGEVEAATGAERFSEARGERACCEALRSASARWEPMKFLWNWPSGIHLCMKLFSQIPYHLMRAPANAGLRVDFPSKKMAGQSQRRAGFSLPRSGLCPAFWQRLLV